VFMHGYYPLWINDVPAVPIVSGQIENNEFDASLLHGLYLYDAAGGGTIPLGGNYWFGGSGNPPLPSVVTGGTTTQTVNFGTALAAPPAGAGPDW